jgi:hypothetical protein
MAVHAPDWHIQHDAPIEQIAIPDLATTPLMHQHANLLTAAATGFTLRRFDKPDEQ